MAAPSVPPYQTAIITGASSGIGLALAEKLVQAGVQVALLARREDMLRQHVERFNAAGGRTMALACDVSDQASVRQAVKTVREFFGPIDLAIANAGVANVMTAENLNMARVEWTYKVNVFGALYLIEAVLPDMMARREGHLVGISSLASYRALPNLIGYSGSKSALNRELEAIRNQVHKFGISVTTICPGFIRTSMTENADLPQPMRMELAPAAVKIYGAVIQRKKFYAFPWSMALVTRLFMVLPARLFDLLARNWDRRL